MDEVVVTSFLAALVTIESAPTWFRIFATPSADFSDTLRSSPVFICSEVIISLSFVKELDIVRFLAIVFAALIAVSVTVSENSLNEALCDMF